ncbi:hypothetical protein ACHAXR_008502, partial [Thalassiosira sp. AJA248-18]
RWSSSGKFLSSEVFKMYTLRLFYASSFGRVDEDVITALHNDFKIWLGAFVSFTRKLIPGTAIYKGMKARDRILKTFNKLIDTFMKENGEESERAKTTVIGCLVYGKDKDNNQMMTRDEVKDNMLNIIFAGHDTTFASISSLLYHLSQNPDAMEALAEEDKDNNRMMTRDEVKDNMLTIIFAGHDTTFASISSLLYHLSQNPDAMEALAKEVSTMSEPLRSDELKNAPVLNACMHESWRMDPPAPGGFRKAAKEIQHKGYSFDVGTQFHYSILLATSDESLYKNHGKFNMRRFLPKDHYLYRAEDDSGIDPSQGRTDYPIFGGGSHVCLGKAFAQLELRVLAARMVKHYHLEVRNPRKVWLPINTWNIEFKLTKKKIT